jgi:hypothetical protein
VTSKNSENLTMLIGHAVEDFTWNEAGTIITGQWCWSTPTPNALQLAATSVIIGCQHT